MREMLREIWELNLEGKKDREEVKKRVSIKMDLEEIKKEARTKEEKWERVRGELKGRIGRLEKEIREREGGKGLRALEKRIEELEKEKIVGGEGKKLGVVWEKMRKVEQVMEREERVRRKRNLIFKGLKEIKGELMEKVVTVRLSARRYRSPGSGSKNASRH